jgi:hypothetical protein
VCIRLRLSCQFPVFTADQVAGAQIPCDYHSVLLPVFAVAMCKFLDAIRIFSFLYFCYDSKVEYLNLNVAHFCEVQLLCTDEKSHHMPAVRLALLLVKHKILRKNCTEFCYKAVCVA